MWREGEGEHRNGDEAMAIDSSENKKAGTESRQGLHHAFDLVLENEYGLHIRPASEFVKIASQYQSEVWVKVGASSVNGKSLLGLMTLEAGKGTRLSVEVTGDDAPEAMEKLTHFLKHTLKAIDEQGE